MVPFSKQVQVRWSDLDPNFHLRHSVYYDFGAYCRMCFLNEHGATPAMFLQHKIGPVLLREECVFRREIHFADDVSINMLLKRSKRDMSRWSMVHEITKSGGELSAIITIDGAWMDTEKRKLVAPSPFIIDTIDKLAKTPDFEWLADKPAKT